VVSEAWDVQKYETSQRKLQMPLGNFCVSSILLSCFVCGWGWLLPRKTSGAE